MELDEDNDDQDRDYEDNPTLNYNDDESCHVSRIEDGEWTQPSDTFSVLLIVGGDVIQLTLANLTGVMVTPITFSFGWVAYAITATLGAMSDNRHISCRPEVPVKVLNLETS
ncbi:hypothetical protein INS49_004791 [Diaporthe citri]|uniref:uncharacterized protein n=1 Tax=Diaporthe citri TaxID=83186 RepID=UPI001C806CEE|nr:uncharacterized protein INS49_004791 [Diaporthe citri]KAG6354187.1 hypothetical protein INS49_004791 [Diaporthe citri]